MQQREKEISVLVGMLRQHEEQAEGGVEQCRASDGTAAGMQLTLTLPGASRTVR